MGAAVTAGIGTVCNSLYDISISYEGAREAVSYRVLYGTKRAINIAEIVPKESKKAVPLEETRMQELFTEQRVKSWVWLLNAAGIVGCVADLFHCKNLRAAKAEDENA